MLNIVASQKYSELLTYEEGVQHHNRKEYQQAEACYRKVLAADPEHDGALHRMGGLALEFSRPDIAYIYLKKAVDLRPQINVYRSNLAIAQAGIKDYLGAIRNIGIVLEAMPNFHEAWNTAGICFHELDDIRWLNCFRNAVRLKPNYAHALNNLGMALAFNGIEKEGISTLRKAIESDPQYVEAHFNLALSLMYYGHFEEGWKEYEWRAKMKGCSLSQRIFFKPQWRGENIAGKRLYIHSEQGFGDTIQFIRFVALLPSNCEQIAVEVQPALYRLYTNIPGITLIKAGDPIPEYDLHCPLLSLPGIYKADRYNIPGSSLLRNFGLPIQIRRPCINVGIVWSGNVNFQKSHKRDTNLRTLLPLLRLPGAKFFSLAKEASEQLNALPAEIDVHDLCGESSDFYETACKIRDLDLVIGTDTAVMHLAASMGKPTWLLLNYAPDWRWGHKGESTPWYPTVRMFRQPAPGDWESLIALVSEELRLIVESRAYAGIAKDGTISGEREE